MGQEESTALTRHAIAGEITPWRRRERLANWAGGLTDRAVRRLLRRLFVSKGVPYRSEAELERSLGLLSVYTNPDVLADPDQLLGASPQPPRLDAKRRTRVRGGMHTHYTFASPYRPVHRIYAAEYRRYDKLDTVHLFAWEHARPPRAAILITHGWGVGNKRIHEQEFGIPYLFRELGLDVYYYVAPFHWVRRPSIAKFSGQLHPSPNLMRTNEAFIQTVRELRAAISWIKARPDGRGEVPLGMMGSSLGGYTTALMASLDERLAFAIPVLPPSSLADLFWETGEGDPVRDKAEAMGMTGDKFRAAWALHSPLSYAPKVPWAARLIVDAGGDTIVPPSFSDPLWEHWERPRRYSFAGSHILQVFRRRYHLEIGRFLARLSLAPSRMADVEG